MAVVPTTSTPPTSRPRRTRAKRDWIGWAFVGPFMLVFLVALVAPIVYSIWLSLFQNRLIGGTQFVGFDNFAKAFADPQLWEGIRRIGLFFLIQVPIMLILSLACALAIDSWRLRGRKFFRIGLFLPYAVPAVVAAFMWGFMYGERFGLFGDINELLGGILPAPLSSGMILGSIANIQVWSFMGYNMLIFYSALRVIPTELYEAAELDGANGWWVIRSIKIPAIQGALVIALVFSIIGSFQLFNEPNILQSLAPNVITTYFTPNMYAYNLSFSGQQYNYSATIALIMGVITVAFALTVQTIGNRKARQ